MGVSTPPGCTELHRMWSWACWTAVTLVNKRTAPLDAMYAGGPMATMPEIDEMAKPHAGASVGEEPSFGSTLPPAPAANQCDFAIKSSHVSIPPCNKLCRKIDTAPDTLQG